MNCLESCRRVFREVKSLIALRGHENIVHLKDILIQIIPLVTSPYFVHANIFRSSQLKEGDRIFLYLFTEPMQCNLSKVITQSEYTLAHVRNLSYQIIGALKSIHARNWMHRDVKPQNILINSSCRIKLCDFGLCRDSSSDLNISCEVGNLTGYVMTRWYRAPEVLCGCSFHAQPVDSWGVGLVLAELILRRPVAAGQTTREQLKGFVEALGFPSEEDLTLMKVNDNVKQFFRQLKRSQISLPNPNGVVINEIEPTLWKALRKRGAREKFIEMLQAMLRWAPSKRLSCTGAADHEFFKSNHLEEMSKLTGQREGIERNEMNEQDFDAYEVTSTSSSCPPFSPVSSCISSSSSSSLMKISEMDFASKEARHDDLGYPEDSSCSANDNTIEENDDDDKKSPFIHSFKEAKNVYPHCTAKKKAANFDIQNMHVHQAEVRTFRNGKRSIDTVTPPICSPLIPNYTNNTIDDNITLPGSIENSNEIEESKMYNTNKRSPFCRQITETTIHSTSMEPSSDLNNSSLMIMINSPLRHTSTTNEFAMSQDCVPPASVSRTSAVIGVYTANAPPQIISPIRAHGRSTSSKWQVYRNIEIGKVQEEVALLFSPPRSRLPDCELKPLIRRSLSTVSTMPGGEDLKGKRTTELANESNQTSSSSSYLCGSFARGGSEILLDDRGVPCVLSNLRLDARGCTSRCLLDEVLECIAYLRHLNTCDKELEEQEKLKEMEEEKARQETTFSQPSPLVKRRNRIEKFNEKENKQNRKIHHQLKKEKIPSSNFSGSFNNYQSRSTVFSDINYSSNNDLASSQFAKLSSQQQSLEHKNLDNLSDIPSNFCPSGNKNFLHSTFASTSDLKNSIPASQSSNTTATTHINNNTTNHSTIDTKNQKAFNMSMNNNNNNSHESTTNHFSNSAKMRLARFLGCGSSVQHDSPSNSTNQHQQQYCSNDNLNGNKSNNINDRNSFNMSLPSLPSKSDEHLMDHINPFYSCQPTNENPHYNKDSTDDHGLLDVLKQRPITTLPSSILREYEKSCMPLLVNDRERNHFFNYQGRRNLAVANVMDGRFDLTQQPSEVLNEMHNDASK